MKSRYYYIIALVVYVSVVIANTPANLLRDLIPESAPVTLQRVTGTLWDGGAAKITINNHVLQDTQWSFDGWQLLTGKFAFRLGARYQNAPVSGDVAVTPLGTLIVSDASIKLPATVVSEILQLPLVQLGGQFSLKLEQASYAYRSIPSVRGTLDWKSANVQVASTARLGDVVIVATDDDMPVTATISNQGGDLKIQGTATLDDEGGYVLDLNLLPNKNSARNINNSLKLFAAPQADGSFQLNETGDLSQLGLM